MPYFDLYFLFMPFLFDKSTVLMLWYGNLLWLAKICQIYFRKSPNPLVLKGLTTTYSTPVSLNDDNYDSWQETENQWQLNLWRSWSAACLCQDIQAILGPKEADVIRAEWRNLNSHMIVAPVALVIDILCVAFWNCYVQLSSYGL